MSVRTEKDKLDRSHHVVDVRIPLGPRIRWVADNEKEADRLDVRIRAAVHNGTWAEELQKMRKERGLDRGGESQLQTQPKLKTVGDLIDVYFEDYVMLQNRSIITKRVRLDLIRKRMGRVRLSDVSKHHANDFLRWRRKAGVKTSTLNKDLSVLRHLFRWAVDEEYLEDLPWKRLRKLKEQDPALCPPTEAAIDAVFAELQSELAFPVFQFIRETGCRKGEALKLKPEHLVLGITEPFVRFVDTKSGKNREVGLTQKAVRAILNWPQHPRCPYVFYNPDTLKPWADLKRPWNKARKQAGYPKLRVHDLRVAHGIKLAEQGVPMHFIQYVLGHSSVKITEERYAQFRPEAPMRYVLKVLEGGRVEEVA